MTPSEMGYVKCAACEHERPAKSIKDGRCADWSWCTQKLVDALVRKTHEAIHRENVLGWDANGSAVTGIDANGDAL